MNRNLVSHNPFDDRVGKANISPIDRDLEGARLPAVTTRQPETASLQQISLLDLARQDPSHMPRLLGRYYSLYREAFPADSRVEDEGFTSFLSGLREEDGLFDVHIFLRNARVVAGFDIQAFRLDSFSGVMIEHLVVSPECRGLGVGSIVFDALESHAKSTLGADLLLAEVHDPNLMTLDQINEEQELGMDPFRRLKFWGDLGFVQLDAPYLVPSEPQEGKEFWRSFTLLAKLLDHELPLLGVTVEEYLSILRAYFGTRPKGADSDPNFCEITELVSGMEFVEAIPPLEKRSFSQKI